MSSGTGFTADAATDTEGKFAYQGILGAAFPIAGRPACR